MESIYQEMQTKKSKYQYISGILSINIKNHI